MIVRISRELDAVSASVWLNKQQSFARDARCAMHDAP
jgi:hypothetical protein